MMNTPPHVTHQGARPQQHGVVLVNLAGGA
jgi:hypothetical protein